MSLKCKTIKDRSGAWITDHIRSIDPR